MSSSQPPPVPPAPSLPEWLAQLGITGIDPALLLAAVTHPSYRSADPAAKPYERLEFLGDAVLNLVVAEEAFRASPVAPEGVLTEQRAKLVNRDALAAAFNNLGLIAFLRAAPGYAPSTKDRGNVIEALFGAVFLGKNYAASQVLWRAIVPHVGASLSQIVAVPHERMPTGEQGAYADLYRGLDLPLTAARNAKNALQELCQKQGMPMPKYVEVSRVGPAHQPLFRVRLSIAPFRVFPDRVFAAEGEGSNRKIAEIKAAERLCDQISLPYVPSL